MCRDKCNKKLDGVLLIAEDTIVEKFGVSEEFFNKENLKKLAIVAGVAVVAFVSYGKKIKKDGTSENNSFKKLITAVAPALPIVVLVLPQLKDFIAKFISKEDGTDWFDDTAEKSFAEEAVTTQAQAEDVDENVAETEFTGGTIKSEDDDGTSGEE